MENLIALNSKKVKVILATLKEQFGYDSTDLKQYAFFLRRKDQAIKIISRDVEKIMGANMNIDSMGLRIGKHLTDGILLSIEGAQLIGPQCTKNIVNLEYDDMRKWLKGFEVEVDNDENKFVIIKYQDDFIGTGKQKNGKIINNIPKGRRLQCSD